MTAKLIGSLCIVAATTYIGFYYAGRLYKRMKYLSNIRFALSALENEIDFSSNEIEKALYNISKIADTKNLFSCIAETVSENGIKKAWESGIKQTQKALFLTPGDTDILLSLGSVIGKTDCESQLRSIRYTEAMLERQHEAAEDEYNKSSKMLRGFGILSGLFIVLILL